MKGLEIFKKHFAAYSDRYALIGGTACTVAMEDAGQGFRATRDLDLVLCVEALDVEFVKAFWDFIRDGGYNNVQKSTGKRLFYRFDDPKDNAYPDMIELFSRKPDMLELTGEPHVIPIPINEDVSSLSAILLDDDYYSFIKSGVESVGGLSVVSPPYLIPLKVRAWMDMTDRKERGADIDSKKILKHRDDVFRLVQLLPRDARVRLADKIRDDMTAGAKRLKDDPTSNGRSEALAGRSVQEIADILTSVYGLDD